MAFTHAKRTAVTSGQTSAIASSLGQRHDFSITSERLDIARGLLIMLRLVWEQGAKRFESSHNRRDDYY